MSIKTNQLGVPVADFSFNADQSRLAVATGSELRIYHSNGKGWELVHTLTNHYQQVSGVDWDPVNDRIVSISHDRNAFVWTYTEEEATWKPTLVVCRCQRSLLSVKWSPAGNKFVIGSGDKAITVCYYDESQDWWVFKKNKKPQEGKPGDTIDGAVTCLDWHENNMHVAAGTANNEVLLFNCFIRDKSYEPKPKKTPPIKWPSPFKVGWKGKTHSRVNAIKFVPPSETHNNASLVATDAASCIYFFDTSESTEPLWVHPTQYLPFTSLAVLSDTQLCLGGYGYEPIVYSYDNEECKEKRQLDPKKAAKKKGKKENIFQSMDAYGQKGAVVNTVLTKHQNTIVALQKCGDTVHTGGLDGRVVKWTL